MLTVLNADNSNVSAWVLLAITYPDHGDQLIVLNKGLNLNPGNSILEKKIQQIEATQQNKTINAAGKSSFVPGRFDPNKQVIRQKKVNRISPSLILITVVAAFVLGSIFGAAGLLIVDQFSRGIFGEALQLETLESSTASTQSLEQYQVQKLGDGFFIQGENNLVPLSAFADLNGINVAEIISTNTDYPVFVYLSSRYSIGSLKLFGLQAGFGLDVDYVDSGALIKTVHDNSPAMAAGLTPGDVIISVDGNPIMKPSVSIYAQGYRDLIGPMQENVQVQAMNGATTRTVELSRTFSVPGASGKDRNINYEIIPHARYLMIQPETPLEPGVYRFEFDESESSTNDGSSSILDPNFSKDLIHSLMWLFVIGE